MAYSTKVSRVEVFVVAQNNILWRDYYHNAYLHLYTQHSSSGPHITSLKIFREYEIVIFFSLERKFSNTSIIYIRSWAHATTVRQSSTVLRPKNCPLSHYR